MSDCFFCKISPKSRLCCHFCNIDGEYLSKITNILPKANSNHFIPSIEKKDLLNGISTTDVPFAHRPLTSHTHKNLFLDTTSIFLGVVEMKMIFSELKIFIKKTIHLIALNQTDLIFWSKKYYRTISKFFKKLSNFDFIFSHPRWILVHITTKR